MLLHLSGTAENSSKLEIVSGDSSILDGLGQLLALRSLVADFLGRRVSSHEVGIEGFIGKVVLQCIHVFSFIFLQIFRLPICLGLDCLRVQTSLVYNLRQIGAFTSSIASDDIALDSCNVFRVRELSSTLTMVLRKPLLHTSVF